MTVSISVNGQVVYARTVRRIQDASNQDAKRCYMVDDGNRLWHNPLDGIIPLAIETLKKIDEVAKPTSENKIE